MALLPPDDVDALDALDDVMAFIDALDASPDADDASEDSDERSSLLRFLDAPIAAAPAAATTPEPTAAAPSAECAAAAPVKEATRKRNAHREKMKREMQYLRLRAAEMEQQLAALRQGTAAALSPADKQLIEASWQRIALHQLEARRESEAENARLKRVLQTHMEMSKSLGQTLGKRVDTAFLSEEVRPKVKRGRTALCDEDEDFVALFGSLDAAFERLDEVMESSGLASVQSDRSRTCQTKAYVSASGVVTPYIELTDTMIGPFPARLVAKAGWEAVLRQFFQRSSDSVGPENVWYSGNTMAVKARTKHTLKNHDGDEQFLNAKVVIRKYIDEENRMVIVWRAFNEIDGGSDIYSDETGWTIVQSYGTAGSIVRTCAHFVQRNRATSTAIDPTEQQDPSVGVLTDLVTACNEEDMVELLRSAENLLLSNSSSDSEKQQLPSAARSIKLQ